MQVVGCDSASVTLPPNEWKRFGKECADAYEADLQQCAALSACCPQFQE